MAKITDALDKMFSVPANIASGAEQKVAKIEAGLQDAKDAAISYGTITLIFQAVSTISVALMAYCAWSQFCKKKKEK
jgi:hypothetical protein